MVLNPLNPEWPKQTADLIDRFVQGIRSKFTTKAVKATNAVVFGLVAVFALFVAAIVGIIVSVKGVQAYLTWDLGTAAMWVVGIIALVGVLFVVVGFIRSAPALKGLGAAIVVIAGSRWALDAGETGIDHDTAVWLAYVIVGGLFVILGAFLMTKRHSPVES